MLEVALDIQSVNQVHQVLAFEQVVNPAFLAQDQGHARGDGLPSHQAEALMPRRHHAHAGLAQFRKQGLAVLREGQGFYVDHAVGMCLCKGLEFLLGIGGVWAGVGL